MNLMQRLIAELYRLFARKGYTQFKNTLGLYESGGRYKIVNSYGYMGKYQFGMARLCDLGLTERVNGSHGFNHYDFNWKNGYSLADFLNSPMQQEEAFDLHFEMWESHIYRNYRNILDTRVNGVELGIATIFIALHFGGPAGFRRFLSGIDSHDGYGNGLVSYMKKFEKFNHIL